MNHRLAVLVVLFLPLNNVASQQKTVAREPIVASAHDVPIKEVQEPSRQNLKLPLIDPLIVVTKSQRKLDLFSGGTLVRTYTIGLGSNPVPDKQREAIVPLPRVSSISSSRIPGALFISR